MDKLKSTFAPKSFNNAYLLLGAGVVALGAGIGIGFAARAAAKGSMAKVFLYVLAGMLIITSTFLLLFKLSKLLDAAKARKALPL